MAVLTCFGPATIRVNAKHQDPGFVAMQASLMTNVTVCVVSLIQHVKISSTCRVIVLRDLCAKTGFVLSLGGNAMPGGTIQVMAATVYAACLIQTATAPKIRDVAHCL
ncbi:hypothetical protein Pelo_19503 [Pelomyxa schiedti]|nr:hypothetical protein Pelo_19503 [Pelomyxa schiedti]